MISCVSLSQAAFLGRLMKLTGLCVRVYLFSDSENVYHQNSVS